MDRLKKEDVKEQDGVKLIRFKYALHHIRQPFKIKKCLKEKNGII